MITTRNSLFRLVAALLLGAGALLGGGQPGVAAPAVAPVAQRLELGPVGALALDGSGNGWAWAAPAPQTFATSFLLRLEDSQRSIVADSTENPVLLPPGLRMVRMVLTADGTDGWAIGNIRGDGGQTTPLLWRYQNGAWRVARSSLPSGLELLDLTIRADGTDGWMTGYNGDRLEIKVLRLRNGAWDYVTGSTFVELTHVALSPDGQHGWATGPNALGANTIDGVYEWVNGRWTRPQVAYPADQETIQIVADNSGNGWLLAGPVTDSGNSTLVRLPRNGTPQAVHLPVTPPRGSTSAPLRLHALSLDGAGRGWVVGAYNLGTRDKPPIEESVYQPVALRLRGGEVGFVSGESINIPSGTNINLNALSTSPDGAHTWLGSYDGVGFGFVSELGDPWPHPDPIAAQVLNGPGRCFDEVLYCLRGEFAAYWAQHGGLEQFGYPITPEVIEHQGDQTYIVQYTQRARFEYHPENAPPYDVLLGLLGNTLADPRANEGPFQPKPEVKSFDVQWFPQTQHNVGPPFLAYWTQHGGLPVFGLPRSEGFEEANAADGHTYLVQYFERNRLEYHPENRGTRYEMLLGLLGVEQFKALYGYVP
jgi:hypothetical protein